MTDTKPGLSLVIPIYQNEENIPGLLVVLEEFHNRYGDKFEAVLVVDGSPDQSWQLLRTNLTDRSIPAQLILLTRNFGSILAIRRGLEAAKYEITAVMAADLQEPPELIDQFYDALQRDEADLTIGVRESRDDPWFTQLFSNMYWGLFRRFVFADVPPGGVDIFACNSAVRQTLLELREHNTSLIGQLFWIGYRRLEVPYVRRRRLHGSSSWTFRRKFRYMLDSFFAFSDLPIMVLLWIGAGGIAISAAVSLLVLTFWLLGRIAVPGYTPLILAVLFTGSLLMAGQGIVGAYVWRGSENTKQRPLTVTAHKEDFPRA